MHRGEGPGVLPDKFKLFVNKNSIKHNLLVEFFTEGPPNVEFQLLCIDVLGLNFSKHVLK
jgi:hypothetical protein